MLMNLHYGEMKTAIIMWWVFDSLTPEGDVYPCEILDESHKIGNIREFNLDFKKLWLSHKAKEEVKFIRKTKCFCTHECFNTVNILFNPKFYGKILKTSKLL